MENAISAGLIVLLVALYVNYLANRAVKKLDRKLERRVDMLRDTSCEDDFVTRLWMEEYSKNPYEDKDN